MEVDRIVEQAAKQSETIPIAVEIMILSALGFCVGYLFLALLSVKSQTSTLQISDARLETKVDTIIKSMAEMRAELSKFMKTEVDVLKDLARKK